MEAFNLIYASFSILLMTRLSRHLRERRREKVICEMLWMIKGSATPEGARRMFGMLLTLFITKQTGEINSFLSHYSASSSVHMEALWTVAAGTDSTSGALFLQVSTVLLCVPPVRPGHRNWKTRLLEILPFVEPRYWPKSRQDCTSLHLYLLLLKCQYAKYCKSHFEASTF